mmetsp:Transcript_23528/g.39199  ORF Transcript_23528/g.39199 Transcript_23528/m.39199 type:complete len:733 (+) Transcript_23528:13-2211(+)
MQLYQIFLLLGIVGVLVLLTSFLTLDFHISLESLRREAGVVQRGSEGNGHHDGHEFFHLPRSRHINTVPHAPINHHLLKSDVPVVGVGLEGSEHPAASRTAAGLVATTSTPKGFTEERKCSMNPLVVYWDTTTENYISPLRALSGLSAPLEDRRYILFQPDLGGWNNIRMALEVVILLAHVTGRILVLPPNAVLYLLHFNKKWKDNKSSMEDFFDFERMRARYGLETVTMPEFLRSVAAVPGMLKHPLPKNDPSLIRQPLWDYLEKSCFVRPWSPGKLYLGLNISMYKQPNPLSPPPSPPSAAAASAVEKYIGDFKHTDPQRLKEFSLNGRRTLLPYDAHMHAQRALYFPGHDRNRLLTHFYSYLFFASAAEERAAKRYMRDRMRYHDSIFCTASRVVEKLLYLQPIFLRRSSSRSSSRHIQSRHEIDTSTSTSNINIGNAMSLELLQQLEGEESSGGGEGGGGGSTEYKAAVQAGLVAPLYVAFHIRRGDFQQKHTRLPAEKIVQLTRKLVPDAKKRIAYIATDERNRSFFAPFDAEYGAVYFLDDLKKGTDIDSINQNHVGMVEQVICASADIFIGTPLSTFTAYITRMRGFMNRTISSINTDITSSSSSSSTISSVIVRDSNGDGGGGADDVDDDDALVSPPMYSYYATDPDTIDKDFVADAASITGDDDNASPTIYSYDDTDPDAIDTTYVGHTADPLAATNQATATTASSSSSSSSLAAVTKAITTA